MARGGPPDQPVLRYYYQPTRGTPAAERVIEEYEGYLQTDGYEIYDKVCALRKDVVHVGCWAHARRKFVDARTPAKKAGAPERALAMIATLYAAENQREQHPEQGEFVAARRGALRSHRCSPPSMSGCSESASRCRHSQRLARRSTTCSCSGQSSSATWMSPS